MLMQFCVEEARAVLIAEPVIEEVSHTQWWMKQPPTEPDPQSEPKPDPEREPGSDPDLLPAIDPEPERLPM
jgi:hypothetical protein